MSSRPEIAPPPTSASGWKAFTAVMTPRISALPMMALPSFIAGELMPVRGIGMIVQGRFRAASAIRMSLAFSSRKGGWERSPLPSPGTATRREACTDAEEMIPISTRRSISFSLHTSIEPSLRVFLAISAAVAIRRSRSSMGLPPASVRITSGFPTKLTSGRDSRDAPAAAGSPHPRHTAMLSQSRYFSHPPLTFARIVSRSVSSEVTPFKR